MKPEVAIFGIACLAAIGFATQADDGDDRRDSLLAACVLTFAFAASNLAWQAATFKAFPLMDCLILAGFRFLFRYRLWGWRGAFVAIAAVQIMLDIAFELASYQPYTLWAILLDATFGLQLALVSSDGAKNVRDRLWPVRRDLLR